MVDPLYFKKYAAKLTINELVTKIEEQKKRIEGAGELFPVRQGDIQFIEEFITILEEELAERILIGEE